MYNLNLSNNLIIPVFNETLKCNFFFLLHTSVVGIGNAAGWIYPISSLIKKRFLKIVECNAIVKTVSAFFSSTCLPGGLSAFYNQLGKLFLPGSHHMTCFKI